MLDRLLGSRLRAKVVGWLFTHPDEWFFVRQLTALLDEDSTNLSRELARLEKLGVLTCRLEGRQKYFRANAACMVFEELKGLAVKTSGLRDVLQVALSSLADRVHVAFVYGSFAEGKPAANSDVDLLLIGRLGAREASAILGPVGRRLKREINLVLYSPEEFRKKAKAKHHFVTEVLARPKIFLIGGENDLGRIAG